MASFANAPEYQAARCGLPVRRRPPADVPRRRPGAALRHARSGRKHAPCALRIYCPIRHGRGDPATPGAISQACDPQLQRMVGRCEGERSAFERGIRADAPIAALKVGGGQCPRKFERDYFSFLREGRVSVLSTCTSKGEPHSSVMHYSCAADTACSLLQHRRPERQGKGLPRESTRVSRTGLE